MSDANEQLLPKTGIRWTWIVGILGLSTLITFVVLYQENVNAKWLELPSATSGDEASTSARLSAIDDLMDRYPLWLGSPDALRERTRLSNELVQLRTKIVIEDTARESAREELELEASAARDRAAQEVRAGELEAAIESLRHALEVAPENWEPEAQVRHDIEAIEEQLEVDG
jgi:hypothetical protein